MQGKVTEHQKLIQYRTSLVNVIQETTEQLEMFKAQLKAVDRNIAEVNEAKQGLLFE